MTDQLADSMREFSNATPLGNFKWQDMADELRKHYRIIPMEEIGIETVTRSHLGCQHELHHSHNLADPCPTSAR